MSYFTIDSQNVIKEDKQNISTINKAHHTQPHSDQAKRKISETQKARYKMMRELVSKGTNGISEDTVRRITKEVLTEFIRNNTFHVPQSDNNNTKPININL